LRATLKGVWVFDLKCGFKEWAEGWVGEVWARGVYGSSSLVKLQKEGENYAVFYLAGKGFFFYIYDVITSPEKEKRSTYHFLCYHVCLLLQDLF
jgi:hypothetical protein